MGPSETLWSVNLPSPHSSCPRHFKILSFPRMIFLLSPSLVPRESPCLVLHCQSCNFFCIHSARRIRARVQNLLFSSAPSCQLAGAAVDYGSARRPDALIRGPSTSGSAARNNKGTTGKLISLDGEEENEDAISAQVRESPMALIVVIVRTGESLLPPLAGVHRVGGEPQVAERQELHRDPRGRGEQAGGAGEDGEDSAASSHRRWE